MFLNVPKCKIIAADRIREALPEQARPSLPTTRFPAWFTGYNLGTKTHSERRAHEQQHRGQHRAAAFCRETRGRKSYII